MSGYDSPVGAKDKSELPRVLPNIEVISLYDHYKNGSPSEVTVNSTYWALGMFPNSTTGSGFFVKSDDPYSCLVATTKSAFADGPSITLVDGNKYPAHVVLTDLQNDLAVLRITGVKNSATDCSAVSLAEGAAKIESNADRCSMMLGK